MDAYAQSIILPIVGNAEKEISIFKEWVKTGNTDFIPRDEWMLRAKAKAGGKVPNVEKPYIVKFYDTPGAAALRARLVALKSRTFVRYRLRVGSYLSFRRTPGHSSPLSALRVPAALKRAPPSTVRTVPVTVQASGVSRYDIAAATWSGRGRPSGARRRTESSLSAWQPRHHFGFHIARRDAIDGDVPFARLARKRSGEALKPRLGRRIDREPMKACRSRRSTKHRRSAPRLSTSIERMTCLVRVIGPRRLVRMTRSISASPAVASTPLSSTPALLTNPYMGPDLWVGFARDAGDGIHVGKVEGLKFDLSGQS